MIDALITSRTRVKLLLKFFLNPETSSHLRLMAKEFGESTNSIRVEVNRLEDAKMLVSNMEGNKKRFSVNRIHPLYSDLVNIVHKYVGLDVVIENVVKGLGNLESVFLAGDLAMGNDSDIIDLILLGEIDKTFLLSLVDKAEKLINRKIRFVIYDLESKDRFKNDSEKISVDMAEVDLHVEPTDFSWDSVIRPRKGLMDINFRELWAYRDLVIMFVKRDFVTYYKQTILGPLWFFIQPLITAFLYSFIFGNVAGLSTDGLPQILFYLGGITIWNYFADSFNKVATTFKDNQHIFGKVYFPRLATPVSIVISNLIKFGIQFGIFLAVLLYYIVVGTEVMPNAYAFLLPVLILMMAGISLGMGMMIASLTTKYRDLLFLLQFGVQLLMFLTPVIYPMSSIPGDYKSILALNPLSPILEAVRYGFMGTGSFTWIGLGYSAGFTVVVLFAGAIIFNRVEKNFMDSV